MSAHTRAAEPSKKQAIIGRNFKSHNAYFLISASDF
jgi:hypothetical protein